MLAAKDGGRFGVCLAIALGLHPLGFALAKDLRPAKTWSGSGAFDVTFEAPPPKPLDPPPAPPAPVAPVTPPPAALRQPEPPPDPHPIAERARSAVEAASALVGAAAKVFVRDDDPESVPSIASGNGDALFGVVAGDGTGKATLDPHASFRGRDGGQSKSLPPPAPKPSGPDLSRPAAVIGGFTTECEFPIEAQGIDEAVVVLVVSVKPEGGAAEALVVGDPGHGFGRAARACALRQKYRPALDHDGHAIAALTAPMRVRFTR